jgi:hypothetical protein
MTAQLNNAGLSLDAATREDAARMANPFFATTRAAVQAIVWEKDQSQATQSQRKALIGDLFANLAKLAPHIALRPSVASNMMQQLESELRAAGQKATSVKVKKSEFGRILANLEHVPSECDSWKGAIKAIRVATIPAADLLREELYGRDKDGFGSEETPKGGLWKQLAALKEQIAAKQEELSAALTAEHAGSFDYPDLDESDEESETTPERIAA